jgi:hypothetical protein
MRKWVMPSQSLETISGATAELTRNNVNGDEAQGKKVKCGVIVLQHRGVTVCVVVIKVESSCV